jgi:ubiquinone/menaquinone biosynthesis C-methylase UbiE
MKKYDPSQAQSLDSLDRARWNDPVEFVAAAELPTGSRIAEIGCGTGWFTFELEKATRPRGFVYALDTQPAMLQILRSKCQNWERILALPCGENDFELDDAEVDVVFHANVLHECDDAAKHLREVRRVLRDGGTLVLIEWLWCDEESQPGPHNSVRVQKHDAAELLTESGFKVLETSEVGPYHYLIKAQKA